MLILPLSTYVLCLRCVSVCLLHSWILYTGFLDCDWHWHWVLALLCCLCCLHCENRTEIDSLRGDAAIGRRTELKFNWSSCTRLLSYRKPNRNRNRNTGRHWHTQAAAVVGRGRFPGPGGRASEQRDHQITHSTAQRRAEQPVRTGRHTKVSVSETESRAPDQPANQHTEPEQIPSSQFAALLSSTPASQPASQG